MIKKKGVRKVDNSFIAAVAQVGFPIAVTAYLLTRFQKSMDAMTAQITELVTVIKVDKKI